MQTKIKNNSPLFDTEAIREQLNIMQQDYMNTNLYILQATVKDLSSTITSEETRDYILDDVIYDLLIWDSSEEPIKGTPEEYLDEISDFINYAKDYDGEIHAKMKILSKEDKLSKISLSITF